MADGAKMLKKYPDHQMVQDLVVAVFSPSKNRSCWRSVTHLRGHLQMTRNRYTHIHYFNSDIEDILCPRSVVFIVECLVYSNKITFPMTAVIIAYQFFYTLNELVLKNCLSLK